MVTTAGSLPVTVERVDGLQLTSNVQYSTVQLTGPLTIGQLTFEPALFGRHFTDISGIITFTNGTDVSPLIHGS